MRPMILAAAVILAAGSAAQAVKPTRFWNLTDNTITSLKLAPAGTQDFGPNQTDNDKDKTVEHDERVKVVDVPNGSYDAHLVDAKGRDCTVKNVAVKEGEVFSIEEKQLTDCRK